MLILRFTEVTPRLANQVLFSDTTGNYNASTNPGGYGTPNQDRSSLAIVAVLARQIAGQYRFDVSIQPTAYNPIVPGTIRFDLTGAEDGVYQGYFFAVPNTIQSAGAPAGTMAYVNGRLLKRLSDGSDAELSLLDYTLSEFRQDVPLPITVADTFVPILRKDHVESTLDRLLLDFTVAATDLTHQRTIRERYLTAETNITAISMLFEKGRYPEAGAQMIALQRQLLGGLPYQTTPATIINGWNSHV